MSLAVPISFTVMEIIPDAENRNFRTKPLRAAPGETIAHLRKMSAESLNISSTEIQLIYYGKPLEDALTFEAAGIRNGSTILVYPKTAPQRKISQSRLEVRSKILRGIKRLSDMKYLNVLAKTEFLQKIYFAMPELDTTTLAILQTSSLLLKYEKPKYSKELDEVADSCPLLGDALMKAVDWAPGLLKIVPPESSNAYSMETASDDSETESHEESAASREQPPLGDPRRVRLHESLTHSPAEPGESHNRLQPEASGEPQPGPSRAPQRGVTGPMLQAALQAAYSSQAEVASQTFAWQLQVMREMGFANERACIEALVKSGGDVDMAVNLLFQN